VLHASTVVVVNVFLYLTLANAIGWLVDGHLDVFIEVSHDDRPQRGVVGVDHFVVNRPKPMEI
jgi:hypothetical protein